MAIDMPHLEFGDKIVLPANVLLELECFKITTPMLFHIRVFGSQEPSFTQYCSVQEFSAPDGQMFIPYWMMQNLHIAEGSDVVITNVVDIPRGIYCRLQPEDTVFLDIAAEIGPKLLMESAFRRYSVLTVSETILIEHGNQKHYVKVLELKPSNVVSLLGDVDLEMDFAAPPQADPKRPRLAINQVEYPKADDNGSQNHLYDAPVTCSVASEVGSGLGVGRRLVDGACMIPTDADTRITSQSLAKKPTTLGVSSFAAAQNRIQTKALHFGVVTDQVAARADTDALARHVKLSKAAFTSDGHRLGDRVEKTESKLSPSRRPQKDQVTDPSGSLTTTDSAHVCGMCLAEVAPTNIEMHAVRCSRNPSYHKFECSVCHDKVLKRDQELHVHCPYCTLLHSSALEVASHIDSVHSATHQCIDCKVEFTQAELQSHRNHSCPHALELCKLCGFKLKRKDMQVHTRACASRTETCEICSKYVKIIDMDAHILACSSDRESSRSTAPDSEHLLPNNQLEEIVRATPTDFLECVYCAKRAFSDARQLERHVVQECLIVRKFHAPASSTKKPAQAAHSDIKTLVQGKLKRRGDATILTECASSVSFDKSLLHSSSSNQDKPRPLVRDPLVRNTLDTRSTSGSPQTTKQKSQMSRQQSSRPPTQLDALTVKPPQPTLPQLDAVAVLCVGATPSATTTRPLRPRPQAATHTGSTHKLQAIRRA